MSNRFAALQTNSEWQQVFTLLSPFSSFHVIAYEERVGLLGPTQAYSGLLRPTRAYSSLLVAYSHLLIAYSTYS